MRGGKYTHNSGYFNTNWGGFNTIILHTFMRELSTRTRGLDSKHCSTCKHYWAGHGQMYCTARKARITARRRNGCKLYKHYGEHDTE